jgi:hypothetical protein
VTLVAAVIAAGVAGWGAYLQRKTGKESAAAAAASAASSARSATVAEEALEHSKESTRTAGTRADAEARSKRYQDAASQLGHENAAIRLAGVYAMSRLADDWEAQRQTCVDVLCGYLRMPCAEKSDEEKFQREKQVRATIVSVINQHLRHVADPSWSPCHFDFTNAELYDLQLSGCQFDRRVLFDGAKFDGRSRFADIDFHGGATFYGCKVLDAMELTDLRGASRVGVDLSAVSIPVGSTLVITPSEHQMAASLNLASAEIGGGLELRLAGRADARHLVSLPYCTLEGVFSVHRWPSRHSFRGAVDEYPEIRVKRMEVRYNAHVKINQDLIDDGIVGWSGKREDIRPNAKVDFDVMPLLD